EEGWKLLTRNWAFFFLAMAVVNEFVWRSFTTDQWVTFKTFGFLPLTVVFALLQAPIMARYAIKDPDAKN
ncbi:MAG: septation protein IspZ, partial [Xanthobacteraceae bacterium]|nr:septation protein IspZ [Xanthobacteraceae bacterium]